MASRTVTVYPANGEKFVVFKSIDGVTQVNDLEVRDSHFIGVEAANYHERIIKTYHELECSGQLREMGPRQKRAIRDLHTHAQNPAFWPAHYTKEERGV